MHVWFLGDCSVMVWYLSVKSSVLLYSYLHSLFLQFFYLFVGNLNVQHSVTNTFYYVYKLSLFNAPSLFRWNAFPYLGFLIAIIGILETPATSTPQITTVPTTSKDPAKRSISTRSSNNDQPICDSHSGIRIVCLNQIQCWCVSIQKDSQLSVWWLLFSYLTCIYSLSPFFFVLLWCNNHYHMPLAYGNVFTN